MSKIFATVRNTKGFTLVETLVAITVFVVILALSMSLFTNSFAIDRKTKVSRVLYEESRVALERIVKEIRRGTVDYEEYWSWHEVTATQPTTNGDYGKNYGYYALQFFDAATSMGGPPDSPAERTRQDENIGLPYGAVALGDAASPSYGSSNCGDLPLPVGNNGYEQCELYLITADGTEKTIIKLIPSVLETGEYNLGMQKLRGLDVGYDGSGEADGQIDTWERLSDYTDTDGQPIFRLIAPESVNITGLKFFISPLHDPRKAFAVFDDDVQVQPHITLLITAQPTKSALAGIRGGTPSITLQTTISARAQNEVKSLK
jgi:prepilin-type N-terminal cleavage/methylation domain-containing protein